MSYLVLARKWRPQTFKDLIGQEHVATTLQNAISSDRVAHAFLFTGARGVGKTSAARILAKALNCHETHDTEPCNSCTSCNEITSSTSVDVQEIDGASNNGVEQVRELRENLKYLPAVSKYKIIIIDEVHMLSGSAFNALLKTLEEPPPHVKFIFATTEPHKLPITILSRCQRFDFKRIPLPLLTSRLRFIVENEGVSISDQALTVVARKGDGSMRDSLSTLDQVLAYCGTEVSDDAVLKLLGVVDKRLVAAFSEAVINKNPSEAMDIIKQVDSFGFNMREFAREIILHFRNLLLWKATDGKGDIGELSDSEVESVSVQAASSAIKDIERILAIILKTEYEMGSASFPRFLLELAAVRMSELTPLVSVEEILSIIKDRKSASAPLPSSAHPKQPVRNENQSRGETYRSPASQPVKSSQISSPSIPSAPTAAKPAEHIPLNAESLEKGEVWPSLVREIKNSKMMLGLLLEKAKPFRVDSETVEIGFKAGSQDIQLMKDKERLDQFTELASAFFSSKPKIIVREISSGESAAPSLAEKKTSERESRAKELRQKAESNPVVKEILNVFSAELKEVREPES